MPHGLCLLWNSELILLHVLSDGIITLAYFSIPFVLWAIARRRWDLLYPQLFYLFCAFIFLCGLTHAFGIWTLWQPLYTLEGMMKLTTAAASATTALVLWRLLPQLLALPSRTQLESANRELRLEVDRRRAAERASAARLCELEHANRRLAHFQRRVELVLNAALDGLYVLGPDGRISYVNNGGLYRFLLKPVAEELLQRSVREALAIYGLRRRAKAHRLPGLAEGAEDVAPKG